MKKSIHELKTERGEQDQEDLALLQRVATRDRQAFEQLYARHYQSLARYLSRLMRRPDMVEEVVNDTMFVVWEKAAGFEGRSKVSTWITGIAYLKGIKALDRLKMRPEQNAEPVSKAEELEEDKDLIARLGLDDWLSSGLELISPDQRSVVELTYYSGYSYQEIADLMDCPVNTVKTRMFHARKRLAKLLPLLQEHNPSGENLSTASEELEAFLRRDDE